MTVLNAHFDGRQVVLDDPMPSNIPPNTQVKVLVEEPTEDELDDVIKAARPGGMPPDFAAQHEHYTKGTPRR